MTGRSHVGTLPTGTVTFLFTDIEGSTRLVQELGDRYADVLAEHCRIIRSAIAAAGGTEVGTDGDSFFAVFPSAPRAVEATVAAQRALAAHAWPEGTDVRVRMGLHTGDARLGGDNYIGIDVNRAARIAAAGHGGQVLLSDSTRSLVESSLPPGASLREMGAHRLKDLATPERLFQIALPDLPADFPALRTLDARANNLPVQLTSFVGRDAEIAALVERLDHARMVTLTGPGGTGKTRLALQVAAERLARHTDGVFFVELAPIIDPGLVASAIGQAIGIREAQDRPMSLTLREALRDRDLLLLLDNFEQVLDAAPLVTDLLSGSHRLRVLVTSRALLHVHGEQEHPVPPLRIPDPAALPAIGALSQYEGVALFVERAMATRPDFAVTAANAPAIAEIVARLDGLPLAIELAAAKTRLLDPPAILGRLGSRLSFLTGGPRDLPARQRTLREAIDWSYALLAPSQQALLRRLAVFVGGWALEDVEAVAHPSELGLDPLEGIGDLLDQSLVRRADGAHGEARFVMLETIREYGLDQLTAAGEAEARRDRHAAHFLSVAEALEPNLLESPGAGDRLARDHENVRAALARAIESDDAELGLRLGFAMWRFWQQRGHLREGRKWFERLLVLPGAGERTKARALGLTGAAGIAYWQNDYPAAEAWYDEAEAIYRELGDRRALADALFNSGSMRLLRGDAEGTSEKLHEGTMIGRELGEPAITARFLGADGYAAFMADDLPKAHLLLDEALVLTVRLGHPAGIGMAHHMVAQVARIERRFNDAERHYRDALRIAHGFGDAAMLSEPLQGLAAVAIATGEAELGVRLLGANAAIRERLGGGPPPEWLRLGDPLADARQAMGPEAFDRAWGAGLASSVDEAVEAALAQR